MYYLVYFFYLLSISTLTKEDNHKFYVSTTNVVLKSENNSLQITGQVFIDDIEELLRKDNRDLSLDPDSNSKKVSELFEQLIKQNSLQSL